jgi:diaminopimelate decarboxylase
MNKSRFKYKDNNLYVEGVSIEKIVKKIGTPVYVYSESYFHDQLSMLKKAFEKASVLICYSLKVCHNVNVVKSFVEKGCGLDIVSGGELYRGIKSGVDPKKIIYSGVAKTTKEIREAIQTGILMFNVESEQELDRINKIGGEKGEKVPIAIRVNPNVDAQTHPHITTGMKKNKFGIDHSLIMNIYKKAKNLSNIEIVGIDCHIGSQILDIKPFRDAIKIIARYTKELQRDGINIKYVDVGGGLGIPYKDSDRVISCKEYANAVTKPFKGMDIMFILEPGRFLTASAGVLIAEVQYTKENSAGKKFVIINTGMHHLIRPPLYDGFHRIIPLKRKSTNKIKVDVVGPICESTDFLARDRELEEVESGDILAITDVGAYGMVLSSHYNSHPLPPEVLVKGSNYKIIREKETYEDLLFKEV